MAPYYEESESNITEDEYKLEKLVAPQAAPRKHEIVLSYIIFFSYLYLAAFYGLYLAFTSTKWVTMLFGLIMIEVGSLGVTAGAHRLWTHRSYKAKLPLQIILIIMNSIGYQHTVFTWVRNHRMHHKYSDTDADPHNATRGLFFSHFGWLLVKKHPEIKKRGKFIYMDDILSNPVVMFQYRYSLIVIPLLCYVLPVVIPMYFWDETFINAWHTNILRHVIHVNITCTVNSLAHHWGYKPYDKDISPVQSKLVSFLNLGEGFHNYHHVFPWDYRTAELGNNNWNMTAKFIDFFAWIGWAYDLKTVSDEVVKARMRKTGDGTNLHGQRLNVKY